MSNDSPVGGQRLLFFGHRRGGVATVSICPNVQSSIAPRPGASPAARIAATDVPLALRQPQAVLLGPIADEVDAPQAAARPDAFT